jgi:chromosome segregation ATPase
MINASNLLQAIEQLKREIQREEANIVQHKGVLQAATKEKQTLEFTAKQKENDIRSKEADIQHLKSDIQQLGIKISAEDQNIQKITYTIARIEREVSSRKQQLDNAQRDVQMARKTF